MGEAVDLPGSSYLYALATIAITFAGFADNVRTETLRTFDQTEMGAILKTIT